MLWTQTSKALALQQKHQTRKSTLSLNHRDPTGEGGSDVSLTRRESVVVVSEAGGVGGGSDATYFLSATSMSDGSRTCCIATHCSLSSFKVSVEIKIWSSLNFSNRSPRGHWRQGDKRIQVRNPRSVTTIQIGLLTSACNL